MSSLRSVLVGQRDLDRIHALLRNAKTEQADLLYDELDAATIVYDDMLPDDVVTMHSTVRFVDLASSVASTVTLVYPDEVGRTPQGVSILAPVGAALIGLRVGEIIEWPLPNGGARKLEVVAVQMP